MALHIRNQQQPQHVRQQQPQHVRHVRQEDKSVLGNVTQYFQDTYSKMTSGHIRSSPKMMLGMIFGFLLMVILIVVALHYFRLYSFPFLSFIPQKPAPASHLQYFFF